MSLLLRGTYLLLFCNILVATILFVNENDMKFKKILSLSLLLLLLFLLLLLLLLLSFLLLSLLLFILVYLELTKELIFTIYMKCQKWLKMYS